jgi:hypothetical protein
MPLESLTCENCGGRVNVEYLVLQQLRAAVSELDRLEQRAAALERALDARGRPSRGPRVTLVDGGD